MSKKQKKELAQDLIMSQLASIGYGERYEDFVASIGNQDEADSILLAQMDRVAKLFGYENAWFS